MHLFNTDNTFGCWYTGWARLHITESRGGQPAAREPHAALLPVRCVFFHMVCFLYQQPSSVIMLRWATHKMHDHVIMTLLRELR